MADIKISELPAATNVAAGDLFEVSQGSGTLTSRKATGTQVQSFVLDSYTGASTIATVGTINSGTWQGSVVAGQYGGTGVNNSGKTITLGGNFATSGAFGLTFSLSNTTSLTLPISGTLATLAGTETLSGKTVEAATFSNGYTEEVVTANTGTAYTIDLANGSVQNLTLTGSCVFTFPSATAGRSFLLILRQDATGSRTVTWPTVTDIVRWPGGTAPTLTSTASRVDVFAFTADGTRWFGRTIAQNYTA
jgi:hypothetical protein